MENAWLNSHKKNIKSQHGEDGIIEKIFEIIPNCKKWCVEFGAWDGQVLSNTWNLINNQDWSGVLIECEEERFNEMQKYYEGNPKVNCVNRFVNFNGENTLDNILNWAKIPVDFDLLSIDIDGNDYHIWDSIQDYKPKVVVIEYNPTIPNDIKFIQKASFKINHGSSLLAMVELGKSKGYEFVATTLNNAFFVKEIYYRLFNISDNSLYLLRKYNPEVECRVYQLYDGTMVYEGNETHCMTGYHIRKNRLQIMPRILRMYQGRSKKPFYIRILSRLHSIFYQ
jgi:hypothetical protein